MVKREYSNYQKDVIGRYYANIDSIALDNLQQLVTELYLAGSEKKQERLWARVHKAMIKLKVKPAIVEHIMKERNVTILAKNVQDWLKSGK